MNCSGLRFVEEPTGILRRDEGTYDFFTNSRQPYDIDNAAES